MVVEHTRALVSYDDRKKSSPQNRDYEVACQCAHVLKQKGVDAAVKGYSDSALDADTHWLILIHSSDAKLPSSLVNDVNTALDYVVARRMRDVMVISTDSSDLRPEWASIRKYDISRSEEEKTALRDMLRAMEYVKLPYNQALNQQKRHALWNGRQKAPSVRQLIVLVSAIVIVMLGVVGSIIYLPGYLHPVSTSATATASARATMTRSTGTVTTTQTIPGVSAATQNAKRKELSTLTKGTPTIPGFQAADKWSNPPITAASSCTLNADNTYTAKINTSGQYNPCLAALPAFTNLVMQVTMKIQGDAGGIIFRSKSSIKEYYRLAVNQSNAITPTMDTFSLRRCDADCTDNSVTSGTSMTDNINTSVQVNRAKPFTLSLIAQTTTFDVFINGQFVASITDTSYTHTWPGQIGVYAASLSKNTTVTFSNLKVWSLDHPTTQPTSKPTSQPTPPSVIQPTVIGAQGG